MDQDRLTQWIDASHVLARTEPFLVVILQWLGHLDCHLISDDARHHGLSKPERDTIPEAMQLTERLMFSYLWILGAYEVVRTIDQRCWLNPDLYGEELAQEIRVTKKQFARLRVPLAKFEAAKAYPGDSPIAYPAIGVEGIAWQLGPNTFISRRQLSDSLLALVRRLRAWQETEGQ